MPMPWIIRISTFATMKIELGFRGDLLIGYEIAETKCHHAESSENETENKELEVLESRDEVTRNEGTQDHAYN